MAEKSAPDRLEKFMGDNIGGALFIGGISFITALVSSTQDKSKNNDVLWAGALALGGAMAAIYGKDQLQLLGIGSLGGGSSYLGMRLSNQVK